MMNQSVLPTISVGPFVAIIGRARPGKTTLLHRPSRRTVATAGALPFGGEG